MRYIVDYFPQINEVAKVFIRHTITPMMISIDKTSSHYHIELCVDELEEANKKGIFNEDIELLNELMKERVEYIEI